jgi:catechol 2,3-dioxygenase-like lactoylglutathione lyase family enzyme
MAHAGSGSGIGDLRLGAVVINVRDMDRAVRFWIAAIGYVRRDPDWDPTFTVLAHPSGAGPAVSVQLTDAPKQEPGRIHLDLYTAEQDRHVERLVALGATRADDWDYPPDPDFIVLRDPDGNEFCVIDYQDS